MTAAVLDNQPALMESMAMNFDAFSELQQLQRATHHGAAPVPAELSPRAIRQWVGYEVLVTPAMATKWLAANTGNRKSRPGHIRSLCAAMEAGEWKATHQGVAFGADGRLIDGQHRLLSVVRSGVSVPMVVFTGCPVDGFAVLDSGAKRGLRDHMMKDGRIADQLAFLVRLTITTNGAAVRAAPAISLFDAMGTDMAAILNASGTTAKNRTGAGIRAAVSLRHAIGSPADRQYLLTQWRAWTVLSLADLSPSVGALLRRLESVGSGGGAARQKEDAACAWRAFDPKNQNNQRIQVKSLDAVMQEMRTCLHGVWRT